MSNTATLAGHIGNIGTLTAVGTSQYLGFTLASNRRTKRNGEWTDATTWWSVRIWGERATGLAKRLAKGDHLHLTGEPYLEEWTGKDGHKRSTLRLDADRITVLRRASDRTAVAASSCSPPADPLTTPAGATPTPAAAAAPAATAATPPASGGDDEPPF